MNTALILCPVCEHRVSAAAPYCVQCGHPMQSSGVRKSMIFGFIAAGLLVVVAVVGYKLDLHTSWLEVKPDTAQVASVQEIDPTLIMSERELALELQGFVLRANRTLPHRPNAMLTLERIHYKPKPSRLTYDYELSAAAGLSAVALESVRPALMNRYCTHDDFKLASANSVEVTFRYLELGRVVHSETIIGCDPDQIVVR